MTTEDRPGALDGLRVVELGDFYAAAYATRLLADLGADVIKVESGTTRLRRYGPHFPGQEGDIEAGGLHLFSDAGKSSVLLDLDSEAGREQLDLLLDHADAVVTDLSPARLDELDLAGDKVAAKRPHLVYTTISPFGSWGPYSRMAATHINAVATGGGAVIGEPGRHPLQYPYWQGHVQGAIHAAAATLMALRVADDGGQWIDISEADIWNYHIGGGAMHSWVFFGRARQRSGRSTPNFYPHGLFRCKDGYIAEAAVRGSEWKRFLELMGGGELPEWARSEKYRDRRKNAIEYEEELDALQEPWLMERTKEEIFVACQERRIPFAPVYTIAEVLENEHLRARDHFVDLAAPDGRGVTVPGAPYRLSVTPARPAGNAPKLGQDNHRLDELDGPRKPPIGGAGDRLPLAGVRVVDFSAVIAGPICARVLADYGAEVIKIESRRHIDSLRMSENNPDGDPEHDSMFHFMNRNKKSVTINIATERGRELALELVQTADVSIENFSPGAMERRGLGADHLREVNPGLVTVSLPAAGSWGPLRDIVAYGSVVAAISGFDSLAGYEGEPPLGIQGVYADWNSGIYAVLAILAALRHRDRTGEGQHIDLAQWEAATTSLAPAFLEYSMAKLLPETQDNLEPTMVPHNLFPTEGSDKWVAIACRDDEDWRNLRRAIGEPEWAQEAGYHDVVGRKEAHHEIEEKLSAWTSTRSRDEVVAILQEVGVPATPLLDVAERFADAHSRAREAFVTVQHETMGPVILGGMPWKLSRTPGRIDGPGPVRGSANQEILGDLLEISDAELKALEDAEVVH